MNNPWDLTPDGRIEVTHAGRPVVTPAPGQHVIVLDGLTPDEVRVITALVKAMRESKPQTFAQAAWGHVEDAKDAIEDAAVLTMSDDYAVRAVAHAAWHIAHAISQMGES